MFSLASADLDERQLPGELPADYVTRLAGEKARAVLSRARPEHIIIGSDTAVVVDGEIWGKPADEAEARSMLQRLRGRTHQVYTGIAALRAASGEILSDLCVTEVPMRAYSDAEIERYIASGDPLDKAGAYGIQHPDFQPVINMAGCYAGVMGLPLCHLTVLLRRMGVHPRADVARNCQTALRYACPVSRAILRRADLD
ncbi:MAG: Maf family nucleotide pyrophosphatase [Anaerolineales bacterium]